MDRHAIDTIGLDADDTLWHNEIHFQASQEKLARIVAPFADRETLGKRLLEIEHRNLKLYGYGIKGFTLSMIEAAVNLSDHTISGGAIAEIIDIGRDMLVYPIEPLPGVMATLAALRGRYRIVIITKGDLLDQEAKIARSGLGDLIDDVQIVSEKTAEVYTRIFGGPQAAKRAVMIGNSLKSDVLPALEHAEEPPLSPRFHRIEQLADVLQWLGQI